MSDDLHWLEDDRISVNLEADLYHSTKVCYDYQSVTVSLPYSYTSPQEVAPRIWKVYHLTHGHFYYYNQITGDTSWSALHNPGATR